MNIKNFSSFEKNLQDILKPQLENSKGDFPKFKNLIFKGYDDIGMPILNDDIKIEDRYLNYIMSMGKKNFNSFLYRIFTNHHQIQLGQKTKKAADKIDCDPTGFKILGPMVAKDEKALLSYWVNQSGGKVYKIVLPDDCNKKLTIEERNMYVTVEPKENRIHFPKGVPDKLRGKGLGGLVYLTMIKKLGYITSSMGNSAEIKMVYSDLITNPKYEGQIMSLLLEKQILIFDRNTKLDVNKIFKDFVSTKYTNKKSVRISPILKETLGKTFTEWYESLEGNGESIEDKIQKNKNLTPKESDTVYDTKTKQIFSFSGMYEDKMYLISSSYKNLVIPKEEIDRLKVVFRPKI
jgi:hypothetical protein